MRGFTWLAVLAAVSVSAAPVLAAPPPAEVFGALPQVVLARLSPDGKRLAVVKPVGGDEKIMFYDLNHTAGQPFAVGMEGGIADTVFWKSNTRALCVFHANLQHTRTKAIESFSRTLSVDVPNRTQVLMMKNFSYLKENSDGGAIVDLAPEDPDHVFMTAYNQWDYQIILDLFHVDMRTGEAELALHGNKDTISYLTDGHGHPLGRIDQGSDLTEHLFLNGTDLLQIPVRGRDDFEIQGPLPGQPLQFAVERPDAWSTTALYPWGAVGGFGAPLFADPDYDLGYVIGKEKSGEVIGVTYTDDRPRTRYFDPNMQHVLELMEKAYPGQSVQILSKDDADTAYVIRTEGARQPPVLSLYTPANHQSNIIQEAYPALKPDDLGEVKAYPYKTRDGVEIHAYLTLPPGTAAHHLPTVIFPHGGPEDRSSIKFDWWAQFMASRGYAVLQPNYRGSFGYGWNFIKAGDGEWAGKVQWDLEDGVRKLVADGIADPKRVCIVGASWGGYMALAAASFTPDLYACAVSFAGLSDLRHAIYEGTTFESEGVSIWKRRFGAQDDASRIDAQSPVNFAARVKIPILLLHSDKDTTVRIDQSEREQKALSDAHKQVEFVKLDGDDHYLEFAATRTQLLKEVERFLKAHIGS
jgi:dienelactone hydrolase